MVLNQTNIDYLPQVISFVGCRSSVVLTRDTVIASVGFSEFQLYLNSIETEISSVGDKSPGNSRSRPKNILKEMFDGK